MKKRGAKPCVHVHSQGLCIEWRIFNLEAIVATSPSGGEI